MRQLAQLFLRINRLLPLEIKMKLEFNVIVIVTKPVFSKRPNPDSPKYLFILIKFYHQILFPFLGNLLPLFHCSCLFRKELDPDFFCCCQSNKF